MPSISAGQTVMSALIQPLGKSQNEASGRALNSPVFLWYFDNLQIVPKVPRIFEALPNYVGGAFRTIVLDI